MLGINKIEDQQKFIAQVRVITFDASIGQEADATIILFVKSCISPFISKRHRLNVAISRHKYDWVIMGDVQALCVQYTASGGLGNLGKGTKKTPDIQFPPPENCLMKVLLYCLDKASSIDKSVFDKVVKKLESTLLVTLVKIAYFTKFAFLKKVRKYET